jgi:hypothetical protein
VKGLDGGPLGFLAWTMPQLVGSFAYDCLAAGQRYGPVPDSSGRPGAGSCFAMIWLPGCSMLLMMAGYELSCLSMNYSRTDPPTTDEAHIEVAESPVIPPARTWGSWPLLLWAPPPFQQPSASEQRQLNYWLMDKRVVTLPFNLFSTGFSLAAFTFFVVLSDLWRVQIGFFRTLGQNALAAYVLHEIVDGAVHAFVPHDSPLWWVLTTFAAYVGITYLFVRHLEKQGIYIRM